MARDKARSTKDILKSLKQMLPSKNPKIYLDNTDPNTFEFLLHGYARYFKRLLLRQPQEELVMSRNDGN